MATIRPEQPTDAAAIRRVVKAAFDTAEHSDHTEHDIVDALRAADALAVSLVVEDEGSVIGYVAASPVTIGTTSVGWLGIGPVAVSPVRQGTGIGSALMKAALERLRHSGAAGAVVLGEPGYYRRFGFERVPGLNFPGAPSEYFLALSFGPKIPVGEAHYHRAFG